MKEQLGHEAVRRLLGAYVLGAVAPTERDAIAAHLGDCPSCRSEQARYQPTAMGLARTSDRVWQHVEGVVEARRAELDEVLRQLAGMDRADRGGEPVQVVVASDLESVALARHIDGDERFAVVGVAADVLDTVSLAATQGPDLLVMALSKPDRRWLEAVAGVAEWSPSTRVVMVTGADPRQVAEMVVRGAPPQAWVDDVADQPAEVAPLEAVGSRGTGRRAARRSIIDEAMWQFGIGARTRS